MSLPQKAVDSLLGYNTGTFGYREINMNAYFANLSTDYLTAGTTFTPPVSSRNNEQWKQVEVNEDEYQYDGTMYFPLPYHHLYINTIEIEIMWEGLFRAPTQSSAITTRMEICKKVNGVWTSEIARLFYKGIMPTPEGGSALQRHQAFAKFFYNWNTGYDTDQYIVRPIISYSDNEFRIDRCFASVIICANSVN